MYFKIGEEVQVTSENAPNLNGTYVIDGIEEGGKSGDLVYTRGGPIKISKYGTPYLYHMEGTEVGLYFNQRCLKKIDKGAGSWEDMLTNLKQEEKVF